MTDRQGDFYEDDEPIEDVLAILERAPDGFTAAPTTSAAVAEFHIRLVEHFPAAPRTNTGLGNETYAVPPERAAHPA